MADKPVSIHPQGLVYNKKAEGKCYKRSISYSCRLLHEIQKGPQTNVWGYV